MLTAKIHPNGGYAPIRPSARINLPDTEPNLFLMLKFAIAWAFLASLIFSPFKHIYRLLFESVPISGIPAYQTAMFAAIANYWVPAFLIYWLLLILNANKYLRPTRGINVLFSVANWILCTYSILRIWTSTIEGGGASYALASMGVFTTIPSLVCLGISTLWLAIQSYRLRNSSPMLSDIQGEFKAQKMLAVTALLLPLALVGWVYQSNAGAINKARTAMHAKNARFDELCKQAQIDIRRRVGPAKSVYFPNATNAFFSLFSVLDFAEERSGYPKEGAAQQYRRITKKPSSPTRIHFSLDFDTQMVTEVESEYEIATKILEAPADTQLGIAVIETTVLDRRTNEVLAVFTAVSERKSISTTTDKYCPVGFNAFTFETDVPAYVLGLMDEKAAMDFEKKLALWKKSAVSTSK